VFQSQKALATPWLCSHARRVASEPSCATEAPRLSVSAFLKSSIAITPILEVLGGNQGRSISGVKVNQIKSRRWTE
jgi:hypothetical protein